MSFTYWSTDGFGICTDEIKTTTKKIENLLSLAPNYRDTIHEWFKECEIEKPTVEDYEAFDEDYCCGLATILKEVIEEAEGIILSAVDDSDGNVYLLYTATYPWEMNELEKNWTEKDVETIIKKYVAILTNKKILVNYESVENFG